MVIGHRDADAVARAARVVGIHHPMVKSGRFVKFNTNSQKTVAAGMVGGIGKVGVGVSLEFQDVLVARTDIFTGAADIDRARG